MPIRSLGLSSLRAQYDDEALVILETIDPPPTLLLPYRHILLTKENPTVHIGRTSKRNSNYEATKNNAYFDSAVISREHALVEFDFEQQKVILSDAGSLHGTFHNDKVLARDHTRQLKDGDILRFGIPIERGSEIHPACTMEAYIRFGTQPRPRNQPTVFRVPEDTDIEDLSSGDDDDEVQVEHTARILVNNDFHPVPLGLAPSSATAIDLTANDVELPAYCRADSQLASTSFSPFYSDRNPSNVVDLTSQGDAESQRDQDDIEDFETVEESASTALEGAKKDNDGGEASAEISLSDALGLEDSVWSSPSPHPSSTRSERSIPSSPSNASNESGDQDEFSFSLDEDDDDGLEEQDVEDHDELGAEQDDDVSGASIRSENGPSDEDDAHGNGEGIHINVPAAVTSSAVPTNPLPGQAAGPFATVDKNSYLLHTSLPPINEPGKLPSISTGLFSPPYNGRLPSILAMHHPVHETQIPAQASHMSGAEWLGTKTGKREYFAAREENRMNLNLNPNNSLEPRASFVAPGAAPSQASRGFDTQVPEESTPPQGLLPSSMTGEPKQMAEALGSWSYSGNSFLNSPPDELPEQSAWRADAFLDETSAYQFDVSKKAASAKSALDAQMERLQSLQDDMMAPREVLDEVSTGASTPSPSGHPAEGSKLKRKASEISASTPEEEASMAGVAVVEAARPEMVSSALAGVAKPAVPALCLPRPEVPRPAKRLRRVAEAFGIAALGGAAVMSALIATAPSF